LHEKNNNPGDPRNTESNDPAEEYERYFPELNLKPDEDDFLHDVMNTRIDLHEHRLLHTAKELMSQEDRDACLEASRAFEALTERLSHEDWLVISRYCDAINTEHASVIDTYYREGFVDGLRLVRLVRGV